LVDFHEIWQGGDAIQGTSMQQFLISEDFKMIEVQIQTFSLAEK
jgi:hypothetical protein